MYMTLKSLSNDVKSERNVLDSMDTCGPLFPHVHDEQYATEYFAGIPKYFPDFCSWNYLLTNYDTRKFHWMNKTVLLWHSILFFSPLFWFSEAFNRLKFLSMRYNYLCLWGRFPLRMCMCGFIWKKKLTRGKD